MSAAVPRRLAPLKEACRYGMMGKTTLYLLIGQGKIGAWKRRGRTFIDLDTIDAYNAQEFVPIAPKQGDSTGPARRQDASR